MKKEKIIKYGNPILAVALVALLGSIFTNIGLDWLKELNKPSQWLPNFIIPIVWSVIYSTVSIYLVYLVSKNKLNKTTLTLFIVNGMLNVLWCFVYFANKSTILGLIIIIINLAASILLILDVFKKNKTWGYILLIYPTWLTIATSLNLAIWILN